MLRENKIACVCGIANTYTGSKEVNRHLFGRVFIVMLEFFLTGNALPYTLKLIVIRNIYISAAVVDKGDVVLSGISEIF